MSGLQHEMILASAGSGKTWNLVNRFLTLMRHGAELPRIAAMTFTRKAAGEIFSSLVNRLAEAAGSDEKRTELAVVIPEYTDRHLIIDDLRQLVDTMHRLQTGTLDSLYVSILQTFSLEFGFSSGFSILDPFAQAVARRSVCESVFRDVRGSAGQSEFLEAFQRATFGGEEKSMERLLDQFIEKHHSIFLTGSEEEKWGHPDAIWPAGCRWLEESPDINDTADQLMTMFEADENLNEVRVEYWRKFVDEVRRLTPGDRLSDKVKTLTGHVLANADQIAAGEAKFPVSQKRITLSPEQCALVDLLLKHIMRCEITAALRRTRGIWQILNTWESTYQREVRSKGKLTFGDIQRILAGRHSPTSPTLSQSGNRAADDAQSRRLRIDYRLDTHIDHWLLDEFQDTSRTQWEVIRNLIDEVVQTGDPDSRSLFYVGDVKQAIYGWRGGDVSLFRGIQDHYNQGGTEVIHERSLNQSWRCCQTVIDAVNRVFGDEQVLNKRFESSIANRWKESWENQTSATSEKGFVTLLTSIKRDRERVVPISRRYALAHGLIEQIDPIARGLSCGVLVRGNREGREFVDYLRARTEFPVEMDADFNMGIDNPLSSMFLSLFKAAAHPGDTLSWEHLKMTPVNDVLSARDWNQSRLVEETLRQIHETGFESVIRDWLVALAEMGTVLDPFSVRRGDALCEAAASFDAAGRRSVHEFCDFAASWAQRESSTRGKIQVMTIHKAKGLEFDCVIVLDLGSNDLRSFGHMAIAARHSEQEEVFVTARSEEGGLLWALDLPRKDYAEADGELRAFMRSKEEEVCIENLCLLYVAMTRARHGLYLLTDPVGKSSKTSHFARLLKETLETEDTEIRLDSANAAGKRLFAAGVEDWYQEKTMLPDDGMSAPAGEEENIKVSTQPGSATAASGEKPPAPRSPIRPFMTRVTPSTVTANEPIPGRQIIYAAKSSGASYGSLIHALFEQIGWLGEGEGKGKQHRDSLENNFQRVANGITGISADKKSEAIAEVMANLETTEVKELFRHPEAKSDSQPELWREKAFDVLLPDGELITGIFDRVQVFRNADGSIDRATLIDFKSNRIKPDESAKKIEELRDHHAPQLLLYVRALAVLLHIDRDRVDGWILLTHPRQLWKVETAE